MIALTPKTVEFGHGKTATLSRNNPFTRKVTIWCCFMTTFINWSHFLRHKIKGKYNSVLSKRMVQGHAERFRDPANSTGWIPRRHSFYARLFTSFTVVIKQLQKHHFTYESVITVQFSAARLPSFQISIFASFSFSISSRGIIPSKASICAWGDGQYLVQYS